MGLEAYRLGVKFKENVDLYNICNAMKNMGCSIVEFNSNLAEMEFVTEKYILEFLVLQRPFDCLNQCKKRKLDQANNDIENIILQIRFSKVNPPIVVDGAINFLQRLNEEIKIKIVWDKEKKCSINLANFEDLRISFCKKQEEFKKWFHFSYSPTRCKDVFKFF